MSKQLAKELTRYIKLMKLFVNGKISAEKFDVEYLNLFLKKYNLDEKDIPADIYYILNELFYDVEDFCIYPELRCSKDLTDEELKQKTNLALEKLENLKKKKSVKDYL